MPGRARVIGGGWQSEQYDARPANLDEAFAECREAVERLERMERRSSLSESGTAQLEMARCHLEDLGYLLSVKPCGICAWGSRKACLHGVAKRKMLPTLDAAEAVEAFRLLVRLGLWGHPKPRDGIEGQGVLWKESAA